MAPVTLHGETLGEKHRHYNQLAKEMFTASKKPSKIDLDGCDINNLLQIDLASHNRDVNYILEVLKCEDMLYVSRAIKMCTWLIVDDQYANIINPDHLHTNLQPYMLNTPFNKLMLQIRLKLKKEERVNEFYKYYKEKKGLTSAEKWLQHCSLDIVEEEVKANVNELSTDIVKRLCERSISILEVYCGEIDSCNYLLEDILKETSFLLKSHPEKYLNIMESRKTQFYNFYSNVLTKKTIKVVLKTCPGIILKNFVTYQRCIEVKHFAKYLNQEQFKEFLDYLLEHNKELKHWFHYDKLKHFIHYFPKENRYEFIKNTFIDKAFDAKEEKSENDAWVKCALIATAADSDRNYNWYRFMPFKTAFVELKKLIRAESTPDERLNMLRVLLTSAKTDPSNIKELIKHFHTRHINEPFNFKIRFINSLVSTVPAFRFENETWNTLDEIFRSMDVYAESDNNVQACVENIIIYKILKDQIVPDIIEKKFSFGTFGKYIKYFNQEENEKIFLYLFKRMTMYPIINNKKDIKNAVQKINQTLSLVHSWNRDPKQLGIINKIKEIVLMNKGNSWDYSFEETYNQNKKIRKYMFEESIFMLASQETFINALKHGPNIILSNEDKINDLCSNDSVSLIKVMKKIRIYFSQTLAIYFIEKYFKRFEEPRGHKALIKGLFCLIPRNLVQEVIKKYAPDKSKINWSEIDDTLHSIRKQIALNMYIPRPQPAPEAVLLYAKGDYLQYALPSLNAIFQNQPKSAVGKYILELLNAPVSVQKHGVRYAYTDLKVDDVKRIYEKIWNNTKNLSIRAAVFKYSLEILCKKGNNEKTIEEFATLICIFINKLSEEDNKTVFESFKNIKKLPAQVQGKIFMTAYFKLESLPPKANCKSILNNLRQDAEDFIKSLDTDFIERFIEDYVEMELTKRKTDYKDYKILRFISKYLLYAESNQIQLERFNKTFIPILDKCIKLWDTEVDDEYFIRENLRDLLDHISETFIRFFIEEKMIIPYVLYREIRDKIRRLNSVENYFLVTVWNLVTIHVECIEENKDSIESIKSKDDTIEFHKKVVISFANKCVQYLKKEINVNYPSIYKLFSKALEMLNDSYFFKANVKYYFYNSMLNCDKEFYPIYLVIIEIIDVYYNCTDIKELHETLVASVSKEVQTHLMSKFPNIKLLKYVDCDSA